MSNGITLKQDFDDYEHWQLLAEQLDVYFPSKNIRCTRIKMRRIMQSVNVKTDEYNDYAGQKFEDFVTSNPSWPLYAWAGLLYEYVTERDSS